jgi:hypothetical protein
MDIGSPTTENAVYRTKLEAVVNTIVALELAITDAHALFPQEGVPSKVLTDEEYKERVDTLVRANNLFSELEKMRNEDDGLYERALALTQAWAMSPPGNREENSGPSEDFIFPQVNDLENEDSPKRHV